MLYRAKAFIKIEKLVAQRPEIKSPVTHAETMTFLESILKQPIYSPLKLMNLMPRMWLDPHARCGSNPVLETTRTGREDIDERTVKLFERKSEVDIMLKAGHVNFHGQPG